jgi:hypothetical protein
MLQKSQWDVWGGYGYGARHWSSGHYCSLGWMLVFSEFTFKVVGRSLELQRQRKQAGAQTERGGDSERGDSERTS